MSVLRCHISLLAIFTLFLSGIDAPLEAKSRRQAAKSYRTPRGHQSQYKYRSTRKSRSRARRRRAVDTAQAATPTTAVTKFVAVARPLGARLVIPDIYVDVPVMQGLDDAALMNGPGHDPHSDQPGQPGNCVIAAHRNIWGAEFWHLPNLKKGANIRLHSADKTYHYRVVQVLTVPESDFSVLQRPGRPNISRLTLYTCTKPRTVSRYVVVADLVSTSPADPNALARPIWLQKPSRAATTSAAKPIPGTATIARPVTENTTEAAAPAVADEVIYIDTP